MRAVIREDEFNNLESLETLAEVISAYGITQEDFANYVENRLGDVQDITVVGFDIYDLVVREKAWKETFSKLYHAVVTIQVNDKNYSFGYNLHENRLSFKAGDRGIRYYEMYSNKQNEEEYIAEIISLIKKVAKI